MANPRSLLADTRPLRNIHFRRLWLANIVTVLQDRNHQKAFVFTVLLMGAGFTLFPYITIYLTANAGFTVHRFWE